MKLKKFIFFILLLLGVVARLYMIDSPVADWHSFRQVDTASVTKNLLEGKGTFFVPTYHDFSNLQSGKQNPDGYRMVELPIYNQVVKIFINLTNFPLDTSHRLINLVFSILTATFLFLITKNIYTLILALFLPYLVFYNHAILPETTGVFLYTLSLYLLIKRKIHYSNIFLGLSLLIKPFFLILILPVWLYFFIKAGNKQKLLAAVTLLIAILPFIFWRQHILDYSEGIPISKWLFQGHPGEGLTFARPYWFRWLFYERLTVLISGFALILPFLIGLYKNRLNQLYFLGTLIYFSIIARGNVHHDYYQIITIPTYILICTTGLTRLRRPISMLIIVTGILLSWQKIKEYYKINRPEIIYAGWMANKILPKDSVLIAPYNGDTALLYQTKRDGFPIQIYDEMPILQKKYKNRLYYLSINYDSYTKDLITKYKPIYQSKDLVILDLSKEK